MQLPLFPLHSVLFPGAPLALRIFEVRYLEMTKACIRDETPFGVCMIREGREAGVPAEPFTVGCTALIEQWEVPHAGLFNLQARGQRIFDVASYSVAKDGLLIGEVSLREVPSTEPVPPVFSDLAAMLREPPDSLARLAYDLAAGLPLPMPIKQDLLEIGDPAEILLRLQGWVRAPSTPD